MSTDVVERLARLEERVNNLEQAGTRARRVRVGLTMQELRAKLQQPAQRTPEDIAQLESIAGSYSGPEDLSSNMRDYLYGEKE